MRREYIPNLITSLRMLLVVPVILSILDGHYRLACGLFLVAGLSDGLDGLLARRYAWTSRFGSMLDPLADKLLLISSFTALTWQGWVPLWLYTLVIARDLLIVVGVFIWQYWVGHMRFTPSLTSKLNTLLQILLILLLLISLGYVILPRLLLLGLMYAVLIATVASFVGYAWEWTRRYAVAVRSRS